MVMIEFIVTFRTLDFFDISEVIPLFVLRKRAIFLIEFCPFLVTGSWSTMFEYIGKW